MGVSDHPLFVFFLNALRGDAMQLMRTTPSTIGLDIGASMVKAVKMSNSKTGYILEQYAIEPLADGVIQSGEIRNPSALA
jgi:Tfp pilus assembly PilM family ATPase